MCASAIGCSPLAPDYRHSSANSFGSLVIMSKESTGLLSGAIHRSHTPAKANEASSFIAERIRLFRLHIDILPLVEGISGDQAPPPFEGLTPHWFELQGFGLGIDRGHAEQLRIFAPGWNEAPPHHCEFHAFLCQGPSGSRLGRLYLSALRGRNSTADRFGFLKVREGKSKNARRVVPLTDRANALLRKRKKSARSLFVFANRNNKPYVGTPLNQLHSEVCAPEVKGKRREIFPPDFVLPSLRHTMLSR